MATSAQWLVSAQKKGLFVSESVLLSVFKDGPITLKPKTRERFKRMWTRFIVDITREPERALRKWLDYVLEEFLEISYENWVTKGPRLAKLRANLIELQQTLSPKRAIIAENGVPALLLMEFPVDKDLSNPETKTSRWRASPLMKMDRLLRETGCELGLISNGVQFGIVYSAPGLTASYLVWDSENLVNESESLDQFYTLLRRDAFLGPDETRISSIARESQRKQIDVTRQLGNQVLSAIQILIQQIDRCDRDSGGMLLEGRSPDEVYEMSLFTIVRLIFLLYSEELGLLPHGHPIYDTNYGLSHLIFELERIHRRNPKYMQQSTDAWERIAATFRLVYFGSPHADLVLKAYRGDLFNPNKYQVLESPLLSIPNDATYHILRALLYSKANVRGSKIHQRVSYRMLDVEQIGSVYEGLMEYKCKRAAEDLVVFIRGRHPIRPMSDFTSMSSEKLVEYAAEVTKLSDKDVKRRLMIEPNGNAKEQLPSNLVHLHAMIKPMIIRAGQLYVTRAGGARKDSGSYYTPKQITGYLVKECLREKVLRNDGKPESPQIILSLKICDPAMGSGAFLVQAARYLAEKLVESWTMIEIENPETTLSIPYGYPLEDDPLAHPIPKNPEEASRIALRLVSEKCLFGVDKNPLAVDIAKASLWLVTLSKDLPLTFLDHHLKCGDSLIGASYQSIETIPTRALPQNKKKDNEMILKTGTSFLSTVSLAEMIESLNLLHEKLSRPTMSILDRTRKESLIQDLFAESSNYMVIRQIMDLWTSVWFWDTIDSDVVAPHTNEFIGMMQSMLGYESVVNFNKALRKILKHVSNLRKIYRFFHWELEFPDIFTKNTSGFDAVIGNPPYGLLRKIVSDSKKRDYYSNFYDSIYKLQKGNRNLYKLFLERCTQLLAKTGNFGMIFPSSFFGEISSTNLRRSLFENYTVKEILQFPESTQVFSGVTQDVSILVYQNKTPQSEREYTFRLSSRISGIELQDLSSIDYIEIPVTELANITQSNYNSPTLEFPEVEWEILSYVIQYPPLGGDLNTAALAEVYEGHLHETSNRFHMSKERTPDLLVKGIHLKRYYVDLRDAGSQPRWLKDKTGFFNSKPAAKQAASLRKIIGKSTINKQATRRMQFSILEPGLVVTNNVKFLIVSGNILPGFLLAVLNSGFAEWFISKFAATNRITNYEVENLPIPRCSRGIQSAFDRLAHSIILLMNLQQDQGKALPELDDVDFMLDACIYELYFGLNSGLVSHLISSMNGISHQRRGLDEIRKLIEDSETKKLVDSIYNNKWVRCVCKVLENRGINTPVEIN